MGIFTPIVFGFRAFNTASNIYLAGQVSWWVYREVRKMQKEKLQAEELRTRFASEFEKQYGQPPTDAMVTTALKAYNAVEHPLAHRIGEATNTVKKKISKGAESVNSWRKEFETLWEKSVEESA